MMIQSRLAGGEPLKLKTALLIYEGGERAVCTQHRIAPNPRRNDTPTLLAGVPVERKTIIDLAKQLSGVAQTARRTLLPANLLIASVDCLAWHLPGMRRRIYFQTGDKTFNADVNGREALHPALLFVAKETAHGRDLCVWALKQDTRPDEKTPLCVAPYYNLYSNGHLCEGTYKLPASCDVSGIEKFEAAFFETHFSHTNVDQRSLTAHPHGHHALWREMAKTRRKVFDAKYLKPAQDAAGKPLTVGKVIE